MIRCDCYDGLWSGVTTIGDPATAEPSDSVASVKQRLGRNVTAEDQHTRLQQDDLTLDQGQAEGKFPSTRLAVAGGRQNTTLVM